MKTEDVVLKLMSFQTQLKALHWQTRSFAQHKAFGGAYDAFGGLIDRFTECAIGANGRFAFPAGASIPVENYSSVSLPKFIKDFGTFLQSFDTELELGTKSAFLNMRDEMLGELDQLAYLLSLD